MGMQGVGVAVLLATLVTRASTLDPSWDRCSPVLVDRTIVPGSFASLHVSVIGHDQPHRGYEFWIAIGDEANTTPDAWRFDDGGCQGPMRLLIDHLNRAVVTKTCPSFQGARESIQIKGYLPAPAHLNLPSGMAVAVLANTYPETKFTMVNPDTRYFLGRVRFDHSLSALGTASQPGTCGGLEYGMCFRLISERCGWVNDSGQQVQFTIGNGRVTANGGCQAVPAASST